MHRVGIAIAAGAVLIASGTVAALVLSSKPASVSASQAHGVAPGSVLISQLGISPVRVAVPGGSERFTAEFDVTNTGTRVQTVRAHLVELSAGGQVFPDSVASAARWVAVAPSSSVVPARAKAPFRITVTPPSNREPGERRVGLVFQDLIPSTSGNVNLAVSIVASIWIPGPGTVRSSFALGALQVPLISDSGGTIRATLPLIDTGNVHRTFGPMGTPLSASTSSGERLAFQPVTLLAGQSGSSAAVWTDPPIACWCEIAAAARAGNGQALVARTHVLVLPLRTSGGLLILVLALFGGLAVWRGRRSRGEFPAG